MTKNKNGALLKWLVVLSQNGDQLFILAPALLSKRMTTIKH
jgi:hypothetical protein